MGAVPYNLGYMLVWGAGAKDHAADLEAAIRSTLTSTRFSDPEGAAHPVGVIEVADYYVSHRPSSPLVWGPPALLLALVGSLVVASRKRKADLESDL